MDPCFKSYLSYKIVQPETIHDQAKMNLASRVQRISRKYFEPRTGFKIIVSLVVRQVSLLVQSLRV